MGTLSVAFRMAVVFLKAELSRLDASLGEEVCIEFG
jgi:hypothetical protein